MLGDGFCLGQLLVFMQTVSILCRAADAGFVPEESNATPDPDSAGQAGGVAANAMGDMTDMLGAMFSGDTRRAGQDIADMSRTPEGEQRANSIPLGVM